MLQPWWKCLGWHPTDVFLCLDSDNFDVVHLRLLCVGTQQVLMWIYLCVSASCIVFACFCYGSFNLNFISMIQRFKPMNFLPRYYWLLVVLIAHPKKKHGFSLSPLYTSLFFLVVPSQEFLSFRVPLTRCCEGRFSCEAGKHAKQSVLAGITAISRRGDAGGRRDTGKSRTPVMTWWFLGKVAIMQKRKKHMSLLGSPWFLLIVFVFFVFCWGLLIFLSGSVSTRLKQKKITTEKVHLHLFSS